MGFSPFEALYGYDMRCPIDLWIEEWDEQVTEWVDIAVWVKQLGERIGRVRERMSENGELESTRRKE